MIAVLVLSAAAACSASDPRADGGGGGTAGIYTPADGTRLKVVWTEGSDGQRSFVGFRDTHLGADCSFARAMDGELRCLPYDLFVPESLTEFADAGCTVPALSAVRISCPGGPFARRRDASNPCQPRERVYRLAEKIVENRTYVRAASGACAATAVFPGEAAFRLSDELPPAMFVKGRFVPEPAKPGEPLQLVVLETEDGARVDDHFRAIAGHDCSLAILSDKRVRCVPSAATVSTVTFADAACGRPAAFYPSGCGPAPAVARQNVATALTPGACTNVSTISDLGPRLDMLHRPGTTGAGSCEALAVPQGFEYHALGTEAPPERFQSLEEITERSTHRVWRTRLTAPGGRTVGFGWFDGERQARCFRASLDGKQRCGPSGPRLSVYFADDRCSQPLLRATRGACLSQFAYGADDNTCPVTDRLYSVGAMHTGDVFQKVYRRGATSSTVECIFASSVAPTDVFHSVTPLPSDQFPEMKLVEPKSP